MSTTSTDTTRTMANRARAGWYRQMLAEAIRRGDGCHYCGAPATCLDHVIELQQGGSDTRENLVPACKPCNSRKGRYTQLGLGRLTRSKVGGGSTRRFVREDGGGSPNRA